MDLGSRVSAVTVRPGVGSAGSSGWQGHHKQPRTEMQSDICPTGIDGNTHLVDHRVPRNGLDSVAGHCRVAGGKLTTLENSQEKMDNMGEETGNLR